MPQRALAQAVTHAHPYGIVALFIRRSVPLSFAMCCIGMSLGLFVQTTQAQPLPVLIEVVLASHPAIRSQRSLGEAAERAVEGAQWQFYPTPAIAIEQVDANPADPSYPSFGDKNVTTLRVQQPLWTGGRLTAGLERAQAGVAISRATLDGARQDLGLRVVQVYADWAGAYLKRNAHEKSLKAFTKLQAQIIRRIDNGVSSRSDLTLLLARQQLAEADFSAASAQAQSSIGRLGQLLGYVVKESALAANLSAPQAVPPNFEELLAQAQLESPGILKLQAEARVAGAEVAERQADLMPDIYLRAERQYGNYSIANAPAVSRIFLGVTSRFGAGLSSFSQVGGAQARYAAALADVDSTRISLAEQIQADYAQAQAGTQRLQALVASLQSSDDIALAWSRQFIAGRKTWQDVMNAVRELAQLEAQIADAKASQLLLSWRLAIVGNGLDQALQRGRSQTPETGMDMLAPADLAMHETPTSTLVPEMEPVTFTLRMAMQIDPLSLGRIMEYTGTGTHSKNREASW